MITILDGLNHWWSKPTPDQMWVDRPRQALRVMMERGLVTCNGHDEWSITRDGRAILLRHFAKQEG